jgi:hypothetical protein
VGIGLIAINIRPFTIAAEPNDVSRIVADIMLTLVAYQSMCHESPPTDQRHQGLPFALHVVSPCHQVSLVNIARSRGAASRPGREGNRA